jgi:hypothetical protein
MCLHAALCTAQQRRGFRVVYIDTANSFQAERLLEMYAAQATDERSETEVIRMISLV